MKKILTLVILLLVCVTISFAQKQVRVTLTTGMVITGEVKSFDPLTSLIVFVGGNETTIPADKIAKVENVSENTNTEDDTTVSSAQSELNSENTLIVTDYSDYPDSVVIDIAGDPYTFVLVRGGKFLMGYDGSGSMAMHSEPVHKVNVTSFYISTTFLTKHTVDLLYHKSKISGDLEPYGTNYNYKVTEINDYLQKNRVKPLRLISEAEWEYAAKGNKQYIFKKDPKAFDFCSDKYFVEYNTDILTDPIIMDGKLYSVRRFCWYKELPYKRDSIQYLLEHHCFGNFRPVFKAKDL